MRALKILLILLLVIAGLLVVLGLMGEDHYRIERSVSISAPVESVWGHVSSLGAMDKWSPWNELDPNMTKTMEGTDGTVGAVSKWEGNKDVGKGEQRIDSIAPNSLLRTHLTFHEPWSSETDALIELAKDGEGTKVTWAMVGENDFMGKLMSKFVDMDAMLGKDFEKGLALLKSQAEAAHAARPSYDIKTIERSAALYVGKREVVSWSDMKEFFGTNFGVGMDALAKAGIAPAGAPSGVYFEWNEQDKTADLIAGMPVPVSAKAKLNGLEVYEAPASKALLIEYRGGYANLGSAHEAMDAYIKANGLTHHTNVIEEYITGPGTEPDSTKWLTNIIYLVK